MCVTAHEPEKSSRPLLANLADLPGDEDEDEDDDMEQALRGLELWLRGERFRVL